MSLPFFSLPNISKFKSQTRRRFSRFFRLTSPLFPPAMIRAKSSAYKEARSHSFGEHVRSRGIFHPVLLVLSASTCSRHPGLSSAGNCAQKGAGNLVTPPQQTRLGVFHPASTCPACAAPTNPPTPSPGSPFIELPSAAPARLTTAQ